MKLLRVRSVYSFRCQPFMRRWIRVVYSKRRELKRQGDLVGERTLKLVMNSIYGKFMQNVENFKNVRPFACMKAFEKAQASPRMCDFSVQVLEPGVFLGAATAVRGTKQLARSPRLIGRRILERSRLLMATNHYRNMRVLLPNSRLLYTDADSAFYAIVSAKCVYRAMAEANADPRFPHAHFDLAGSMSVEEVQRLVGELSPEACARLEEARGALGAFGDETGLAPIREAIFLQPKMCSIALANGKPKQAQKGVPMSAIKDAQEHHETCRAAMTDLRQRTVAFAGLRAHESRMFIERVEKRGVAAYNTKVYQLDAYNSLPLGHWRVLVHAMRAERFLPRGGGHSPGPLLELIFRFADVWVDADAYGKDKLAELGWLL